MEDTVSPKDYYDELLPKESRFWTPIRRWEKRMGFVTPIIWMNACFVFILHAAVFTHIYYFVSSGQRMLLRTYVFGIIYYIVGGFGISAGIHRYWSHRAFKAKRPLKIFLLICYASAGQIPIYEWVRDHRLHHKKSETSSDPHDATRGFFFAHFGWMMMKKHPHVKAEGALIDISDITNDPLIAGFDRHCTILKIIWCFIIPTYLVTLIGDGLSAAIICTMVRYLVLLNGTWSVNSFAHFYGQRPYNKNIRPSDNIGVSLFTLGEGSHNFHHTFPWDYKSAENALFSLSTIFLNMFASAGLAYDLKEASVAHIKACLNKHGDRTRSASQGSN